MLKNSIYTHLFEGTLLRLVLLFGVVVDVEIVLLENVFRLMEENPNAPNAEMDEKGITQVMFAVFASTLTLVSLFAAVVFMEGMIGRFIGSFTIVVVIGFLTSLFASPTLPPMLCTRYLHIVKKMALCTSLWNPDFRE